MAHKLDDMLNNEEELMRVNELRCSDEEGSSSSAFSTTHQLSL